MYKEGRERGLRCACEGFLLWGSLSAVMQGYKIISRLFAGVYKINSRILLCGAFGDFLKCSLSAVMQGYKINLAVSWKMLLQNPPQNLEHRHSFWSPPFCVHLTLADTAAVGVSLVELSCDQCFQATCTIVLSTFFTPSSKQLTNVLTHMHTLAPPTPTYRRTLIHAHTRTHANTHANTRANTHRTRRAASYVSHLRRWHQRQCLHSMPSRRRSAT